MLCLRLTYAAKSSVEAGVTTLIGVSRDVTTHVIEHVATQQAAAAVAVVVEDATAEVRVGSGAETLTDRRRRLHEDGEVPKVVTARAQRRLKDVTVATVRERHRL